MGATVVAQAGNRIRIDFAALAQGGGAYGVEKAEGAHKRRWLRGVTSGIAKDGHGERMTERCIKSFADQAASGDVLLYAGKHDFNFIDDVGKLGEFAVDEAMDWTTGYRLYDEADGFDPQSSTLQSVDKVWRQSCGLPPYTKPQPRGFSIEGDIPDNGILYMDSLGRRVIDDVKLAGVVLVRNPAYKTSVAQAVWKALGLPTVQEIRRDLMGAMADKREERDYYDEMYQLNGALEEMVKQIMAAPEPDKRDRLEAVLREYAELYAGLVMRHPEVYDEGENVEGAPTPSGPPAHIYEAGTSGRQALLARFVEAQGQLQDLVARYSRQAGGQAHAEDSKEGTDGPHGDPQ